MRPTALISWSSGKDSAFALYEIQRAAQLEVAGFVTTVFDAQLLAELPPTVDPCGENGEFHTFVTHAPSFAQPIDVTPGEIVERDGFVFADLC